MAQPREVVICGWLQNVRKKTGTLLRKKKLMCDEAMWVALCVHNGRAPHLEWYPNEECMYDHRPKQLLDLLEVALVARSADPRMFVIEFKDENRPSLEFCALSPEESKRWVDGSRNTLNSLSCMIEDNYYLECPSERFPILPDRRPGNDVDENIMPSAAPNGWFLYCFHLIGSAENAPVEVAREARRADINGTVIPPPTLQRNGTYEHIVRGISLLNPERTSPPTTTPIPQSRALMRQPRSIDRPPLPPRKDEEEDFAEWVPSTSKTNDLYNVPKQPTNSIRNTLYDSLPSPEPAQIPQHTRTRSTSSSSDSSMECLSALNSQNATLKVTKRSVAFSDDDCDIRNSEIYTRPRSSYSDDSATVALEQAFSKPRTICLQLSVCVEQLALVEVEGRIWVAGWTPEYNKQLNQMLRVGDEVLEVGGEQLNSMTQIPAVFHTHTIPGTPVFKDKV
ncbi:hypothetical protein L596_003876 [Steinernema carpocapsae]|uniref:PH domain-containing protein n=1 Tax=Steinernema carpocapsae TaxID=34508 RepID=A0A4U8UV07_STECR|nr:hypothetical protein L596_003876 [Steinernema carpocapsae]